MKKHLIDGFLFAKPAEHYDSGPDVIDGFKVSFWAVDLGNEHDTYTKIGPHTLTFEFPDGFDPVATRLAALRAAEANVRAELGARLMRIEDEIAKLLCIEHDPEAA